MRLIHLLFEDEKQRIPKRIQRQGTGRSLTVLDSIEAPDGQIYLHVIQERHPVLMRPGYSKTPLHWIAQVGSEEGLGGRKVPDFSLIRIEQRTGSLSDHDVIGTWEEWKARGQPHWGDNIIWGAWLQGEPVY